MKRARGEMQPLNLARSCCTKSIDDSEKITFDGNRISAYFSWYKFKYLNHVCQHILFEKCIYWERKFTREEIKIISNEVFFAWHSKTTRPPNVQFYESLADCIAEIVRGGNTTHVDLRSRTNWCLKIHNVISDEEAHLGWCVSYYGEKNHYYYVNRRSAVAKRVQFQRLAPGTQLELKTFTYNED